MSDPSVFSLEREILTLVERVEELERQMKIVWPPEIHEAAQAERLRVSRWWVTYNAVRGGMEGGTEETLDVDRAHGYASEAADTAHGPLTPESET